MASIYMKNEITGDLKQIEQGFSWKVFLFSWIYLFIVGDYVSGIVLFLFDTSIGTFMMSSSMSNIQNGPMYAALVILFAHAFTAHNFHETYIKVLEKKDYKIIDQE